MRPRTLRLALIVALLSGSIAFAQQAQASGSDDFTTLDSLLNPPPMQYRCLRGPFLFRLSQGWFYAEQICEWSRSPLYGPSLTLMGDVLVWNDDGYVWWVARGETEYSEY